MIDINPKMLSIDIGSTRTHLAAVDLHDISCFDITGERPLIDKSNCVFCANRIDFANSEFENEFVPSVKSVLSAYPRIREANISSCVKSLGARAKALCEDENLFGSVVLVRAHNSMAVQFNYNPERLGSDRACNALACAALFGGHSCVIIDSGTAITVDYLLDGKIFLGGAILPGCVMQAKALHGGTDKLPEVRFEGMEKSMVTLPSSATEECIKAGIMYGTAGAIERCVSEYLRSNAYGGKDVKIVATGGGWETVGEFVRADREIRVLPDLTLIGAAVFRKLYRDLRL